MAGIAAIAAGAALGLWLNLSSPGMATRAAALAVDANKDIIELFAILLKTIFWTSEHLAVWGSRASVWLLAFALFWVLRDGFPSENSTERRRIWALRIGFIGLLALPYLAALPMFYAYFQAHPTRAYFFVDLFCLIFWLSVLPFAFEALRRMVRIQGARLEYPRLSAVLFMLCALTIAGTENYFQASLDMFRGSAFAEQATAQRRDVAEHPNRQHEVVVVRHLAAHAPTVKVSDITPEPRRWENLCFAEYTGAYGVRVEPVDDMHTQWKKLWYDVMPRGWVDPDPLATGRPRPVWSSE